MHLEHPEGILRSIDFDVYHFVTKGYMYIVLYLL